jgi:hypothetical protein
VDILAKPEMFGRSSLYNLCKKQPLICDILSEKTKVSQNFAFSQKRIYMFAYSFQSWAGGGGDGRFNLVAQLR